MRRTYAELLDAADALLQDAAESKYLPEYRQMWTEQARVTIFLAQERRIQEDRKVGEQGFAVSAAATEALHNAENGVDNP